jgi:transketolase
MTYEALRRYSRRDMTSRFISNVDDYARAVIHASLLAARVETARPSLIRVRTDISYDQSGWVPASLKLAA